MDHGFRGREDSFKLSFAGQMICQETLQADSLGRRQEANEGCRRPRAARVLQGGALAVAWIRVMPRDLWEYAGGWENAERGNDIANPRLKKLLAISSQRGRGLSLPTVPLRKEMALRARNCRFISRG